MFNKLSEEIHKDCVDAGWWDKFNPKSKRYPLATMLVLTEYAEAVEGDRKSLADDHLPEYDMRAVELADAAIRLLDQAGAMDIQFQARSVMEHLIEKTTFKYKTFPEQVLEICRVLCRWTPGDQGAVHTAIIMTFALAKKYDYDLMTIIQAKREYNRKRADHKKENRAKQGGKSY